MTRKHDHPKPNATADGSAASASPPAAPAVDALTAWAAEPAASAPAAVSAVRLDASERLVVPFTTNIVQTHLHFLDGANYRAYVRCGGVGCRLCLLGRGREPRDLLPVYDPIAGAVVVLPVPTARRPGALAPQLLPVLAQVRDGARLLVAVSRPEFGKYRVSASPLPADADDGGAVIATFVEAVNAGRVSPEDAYPVLTAAEIADIPELAKQAKLKGLTL
jgi:hypothetical protein